VQICMHQIRLQPMGKFGSVAVLALTNRIVAFRKRDGAQSISALKESREHSAYVTRARRLASYLERYGYIDIIDQER